MNFGKKNKKQDNRRVCRYGTLCYQKNPDHLTRFKHPPRLQDSLLESDEPNPKKRKNEEESGSDATPNKRKPNTTEKNPDETMEKSPEQIIVSEETTSEEITPTTEETTEEVEPTAKEEALVEEEPMDEEKDKDTEQSEDATNTNTEKSMITGEDKIDEEKDEKEDEKSNEREDEKSNEREDEKSNEREDEKSNEREDEKSDEKINEEAENSDEKVNEKEDEKVDEKMDEKIDEKIEKKVDEKGDEKIEEKVEENDQGKVEDKVEEQSDTKNESPSEISERSKNSTNKTQKKTNEVSPGNAKSKDETNDKNDIISKKKTQSVKENVVKQKEKISSKSVRSETTQNNNDKEEDYTEAKELITELFLVGMPNDFYKFYSFCRELKPSDPATAFKFADLKLVGPYDILNSLIIKDNIPKDKWLSHWRYYYDPPEFQTIVKGNDKEGLHFGYWRDRPSSDPVFVATNCSEVSHKIKPAGENIFGAITHYLEEKVKKANPFEKPGYFNLVGKLKAYAKKHNINLDAQTPKMKSREKNVVARTIHGAGIVCPYNKKTQVGYRELSVTDNQLLKIIKKIDDAKDDESRAGPRTELSEVVRLATIAGDECDFGTCLELAHDLWSTGCVHVQNAAAAMFSIAYNQLERHAFLKIFEAHLANRKKGCNCSALE